MSSEPVTKRLVPLKFNTSLYFSQQLHNKMNRLIKNETMHISVVGETLLRQGIWVYDNKFIIR